MAAGRFRVFPLGGSAIDWRIRGLLDPVEEKRQDGKTKRKILGRENAPQVSRSYPNVARDRPRCRRGGRGGQPRAPGARTECHGERGAREPPFFPLKTESSNNYWYISSTYLFIFVLHAARRRTSARTRATHVLLVYNQSYWVPLFVASQADPS